MASIQGYYLAVHDFYGDHVAKRSRVPLINHINEGLVILDHLGAHNDVKAAFCIHPLIQPDEGLGEMYSKNLNGIAPEVMMLVMEYRAVANSYLLPAYEAKQLIMLSPLKEVNQMLIADKVQNRKDFMIHHYGKHQKSEELYNYFSTWLNTLGVTNDDYNVMVELMEGID